MRRPSMNLLVDLTAFVVFVFLTSTGILMHYLLPPGTGHSSGIWGLSRHDWGSLHFWGSVTFLALLGVHLLLHWRWIVAMLQGRKSEVKGRGLRVAAGVVGLLALVALAAAPLLSPVQSLPGGERGGGAGEHIKGQGSGAGKSGLAVAGQKAHETGPAGEETIRGVMTLREVERETGVPTSYLIDRLGLPASVSLDEKLGPLHFEHGFEMEDVRQAVAEYPRNK